MFTTRTAKKVTLLLLVELVFICRLVAAEARNQAGADKHPYMVGIPFFQTEAQLRQWTKDKLGPTRIIPHEKDGTKVLIAFESIGSGHVITDIYIFTYNPDTKAWGIKAIWRTDTSKVTFVPKSGGRNLTFKSKSGKTLFEVRIEALKPTNDPSY